MKHPDRSDRLGQVSCVFAAPESNKVKQHFVIMLLPCGINSPTNCSLLKLSVHLNEHSRESILYSLVLPVCMLSFHLSQLMLGFNHFR